MISGMDEATEERQERTGDLKETTDYVENFDSEWYLSNYRSSIESNVKDRSLLKFMLDTAHSFLSTGLELGVNLLDVGTGPSIHSILSASRLVQHIDLSDFTPRNLEILTDWKAGKRMTERQIMMYEMNLAGDRRTERDRETELRAKVNGIYRIDVTKEDVFLDTKPSVPLYDVITSALCFESVSTSKEVYASSVRNISKYLRSGGLLLLLGLFGNTYYRVGNYRFFGTNLTQEDICRIFEENGYDIVKYSTMSSEGNPLRERNEFTSFSDAFGLLARKQEQK